MAKRNVEKIKDPDYEIGRYMKKVDDQQTEINELKDLLHLCNNGIKELNQVVDAVMIEVAKAFGKEIAPGELEVRIPAVDVEANIRDYILFADYDLFCNEREYVIRVKRREERHDCHQDCAECPLPEDE